MARRGPGHLRGALLHDRSRRGRPGDLGSLDADGYLTITGRKKELLVLSNGKKVVPTYIEGLLVADECIDQAVVYGEGRNFLTALLVPQWDNLRKALRATDRDGERRRLARHPAVNDVPAEARRTSAWPTSRATSR